MEINSHSLFSKWFLESGKPVQSIFDEIRRKVSNPKTFVCVLIDEVESLTSARKNSMSGLECSDAVAQFRLLWSHFEEDSFPCSGTFLQAGEGDGHGPVLGEPGDGHGQSDKGEGGTQQLLEHCLDRNDSLRIDLCFIVLLLD